MYVLNNYVDDLNWKIKFPSMVSMFVVIVLFVFI